MTILKLDFDGDLPGDVLDRLRFLASVLDTRVVWTQIDRTARGFHVTAKLRRTLPPLAIVAAQASVGSDPKREMYNLARALVVPRMAKFWQSRWNVLYRRKVT